MKGFLLCFLVLASCSLAVPVDITTSTANCGKNNPNVNSCASFVQSVLDSSCKTSCSVSFAAGTYYLFVNRYAFPVWYVPPTAVSFNITGAAASASSLDGAPETTFILSDIANLFVVSPAAYTNTFFANFAVDMARMPYTFGVATSSNTFSIPAWAAKNPVFSLDLTRWPWLANAQAINSYFAAQGRWTGDIDSYMLSKPDAAVTYAQEADGSVTGTVTFWPNGGSFSAVIGQYVILRHQVYQYQVWTVQSNSGYADLTVRGVDIYATAGMGLVCIRCGVIDLERLRISPPRGTAAVPPAANYRPVSITADGVHVENQRIGSLFRLVDSHIEGQGDDCVNVNTALASVTAVSGNTIVAEGYANSFPFLTGDTVNLMSGEDAQFKQQQGGCSFNAQGSTITCPVAWNGIAVGDLVYCANCLSEGTVANNYFGRNRARGTLLRGLGFAVTTNVFDRNSGPAMFAPVDACYFFEGPFLYNLIFRHNTIVASNAGAASQYAAVALVPQVRQYSNGKPVPHSCVDSPAAAYINATVDNNIFIHDVYFNSPLPTTFIADTGPVIVTRNNVTRYAMPVPSCELEFQNCNGLVVRSNTCNGGSCSQC
jgi:hypothetical protein